MQTEKRFKTVFDNAIDGMALSHPKTKKFFAANKMFCQMLGYSQAEIKKG